MYTIYWAWFLLFSFGVAGLLCANELNQIAPPDEAMKLRAENLIRIAVRRRPPNRAEPEAVPVFTVIRSPDGLLDWVKLAYPGTDTTDYAWAHAASEFMEARDQRGDAQTQLAAIVADVMGKKAENA